MEAFKISSFSAGIADGFLSSGQQKSQNLDNFLIDETEKPVSRWGTFVHSQRIGVTTSAKRISGLYLSSQPFHYPIGFRASHVYQMLSAGTWTEILGPTSNEAMPGKTNTDIESCIEWRKQLVYVSAPSTTLPHRIYCPTYSTDPSFVALTLGLPAPETNPSVVSSGGTGNTYLYAFHRTYLFQDYDGTVFEETSAVIELTLSNAGAPDANSVAITAIPTLANTTATNYDTNTISKTGISTTNGSPILTAFASTTNLIVGMPLSGTGISAGALILSKTATTVTMSKNATATGSPITITFYPMFTKIYRTGSSGQAFYYVDAVGNSVTSYTDATSDTVLYTRSLIYTDGDLLDYDQPPVGTKYCTQVNDFFWYATDRALTQSIAGAPGACPDEYEYPTDQKCLGLSDILSFPILFCDRSIYRVEGVFDEFGDGGFELKEISKTAGCIAHKSITKIPGGLVWAGNGGFYFTDGYQVLKISEDLPVRYDIWKNSSICGGYDNIRNLVYWCVSSSANSQFAPNDSMAILHLNYGITPHSSFSTHTFYNNIYPTSLIFSSSSDISATFKNKLLIGESRGYLLYQDQNAFTDPFIDENKLPSAFTKKAIIYRYDSPGISFSNEGERAFCSEMSAEFDTQTELSTQFLTRKDDGGPWSTFSEIRKDGMITWGISEYPWNDATDIIDHDWDGIALAEGKRSFPRGTLRSTRRQMGLTNARTWITRSDLLGTVTTSGKTVTLNTVTNSWPEDCEDYEILFANDSYTNAYKIKSRDSATQVTVFDPYATFPTLVASAWQIRGYRKFERCRILSLTIYFAGDGMTQTPNVGNSAVTNA